MQDIRGRSQSHRRTQNNEVANESVNNGRSGGTNPTSMRRNEGNMVSTHAVNVLSKLATRFKDRSDKFGGDDGENWEDVYSTYINWVTQWGIPEHAALRNIENILAGEAKTYYKRRVQADPMAFTTCDEVNRFILATFHGQEAQEATMEHLDSLSLYELVKEHGSFAAGLRAVRDEIVKHINLVPKGRQTDSDQKRWMKYAVRSYRWARPTTARAHEMDFAQMYSTLRSQAIEEDKSTAKRSDVRGVFKSRVGDKSFGKAMNLTDMYGNKRDNPCYKTRSERPFRGRCFGCGKVGVKRSECVICQSKPGYNNDEKKALQAIHQVSSVVEVAEILAVLQEQYGEDWEDLLSENKDIEDDELSSSERGDEGIGIGFATEEKDEKMDNGILPIETLEAEDNIITGTATDFTNQFSTLILEKESHKTQPDM